MAESGKRDKDENYWAILNSAMELDVKKGHLKWTLSDLSRKSRITRSLIYYYFGRSKVAILQEAIKLIGESLVGMSKDRIEMWAKGDLQTSMRAARELREKAPYLCIFAIEHRDLENEVGEAIRQIENEFKQKIKTFFPLAKPEEVEGIYAVYWGLTFVPEVSGAAIEAVIKLVMAKQAETQIPGVASQLQP